ncbi:MAG: alpha-E domain-containing protein [Pseudomonadota bacterium]
MVDEQNFAQRFSNTDERTIVKFYLADRNNPTSVRSSLGFARENARTVREIVPSNGWEAINDLSLYLNDHVEGALTRHGRGSFLNEVIRSCQFITGTIDGTMSRDSGYQFLQLGRYLERADMTSRIVDVGMANVFPWMQWMVGDATPSEGVETSPYEGILWMSVLRSLSALQMYRRIVPERVVASEVIEFLLQDSDFPRAVACCLSEVAEALSDLPVSDRALAQANAALRHVRSADVDMIVAKSTLYDFIDDLQREISEIHASIQTTWFLPALT